MTDLAVIDYTINLYDMGGRCIKHFSYQPDEAGTLDLRIDTADLKTGTYFLQLDNGKDKYTTTLQVVN